MSRRNQVEMLILHISCNQKVKTGDELRQGNWNVEHLLIDMIPTSHGTSGQQGFDVASKAA